MYLLFILVKASFKILKVKQKPRTNNIMVKTKRTKGQTITYNIPHRKLKNNTNTAKSADDDMCFGKIRSYFSTNGNSTNNSNLNIYLSPQQF